MVSEPVASASEEKELSRSSTALETCSFLVAKNVINLYAKPDSSSEVVSQALFNARLTVEKVEGSYFYVLGEDKYRGWVDSRHLVEQTPPVVNAVKSLRTVGVLWCDVYSDSNERSELLTKLVLASSIEVADVVDDELINQFTNICLANGIKGWVKTSDLIPSQPTILAGWKDLDRSERESIVKILGKNVLAHAERFMGVPYLWGGCSPFGIDCSGLVQVVYRLEGVELLRDADLQFFDKRFVKIEEGKSLADARLQAGDLIVFGTSNNIIHIGIASDDGRFIHASGRNVNFGTYYDPCTDQGWNDLYLGTVRLSTEAELSIETA